MQTDKTKTVLVIDDEAIVSDFIKRIIEKSGYSAIVCTSSLEALCITENTTPELIISDFNLPCCNDGVDLCLSIRQRTNRNMPVIIISGQTQNEFKARDRGFEFLGKPFNPQDLLLLVEEGLDYAENLCSAHGKIYD